MICKKCHVHVEEGETVCPVCGAAMEEELLEQETASCEEEEAIAASGEETVEVFEEPAEETAEAEEALIEEPAPTKKKTWVKVTAIVACLALCLGLAATIWYGVNGSWLPKENNVDYKSQYYAEENKAVNAADAVIATVGDQKLTNSQLQVFYWMGVYEFLQNYGNYLSYVGLDLAQPLYAQHVEEGGRTWEQYFMDGALNTWHSYQSLLLYAQKEGYEVSNALVEQIDAVVDSMAASAAQYGFASADEMVQADMGPSSDLEAYRHYMNVYYGGMAYLESLYDQINPTADEIGAYYGEHADEIKTKYGVDQESGKLIDVRHILVIPTGGTTDENNQTVYSDDEWAACLAKAEDILKQWKDGEATEDSFGALAMELTEDPGSQGTGGLYTYVYEGQMVPAFNDWCFDESRKYGDTDIVKTNYGYHIMFFVYGEEGWIRRTKDELAAELCSEVMDLALEAYPMEVNYKKIVLSKADMAY